MGAFASCPFPFLNEWKKIVDSNKVAAFIDAVLCGFSQIIFSDNSFSGLILLIACFIVSPNVGAAALWSAFIAVCFLKLYGAAEIPLRMGIYVYNPTLAGIIMGGLLFTEGIDFKFFVFFFLSSIFCTITTLGMSAVFSRWDSSALGMPFAITAAIFMAAAQNMGYVSQAETVVAHSAAFISPHDVGKWDPAGMFQAVYSGVSELLGGTTPIVAALVLAAILISSRIDFISALIGVTVSASVAAFFGVGQISVMIGLYGYNGMLLLFVLNGRAFKITARSFVLNTILAGITAMLAAGMAIAFGLTGAVFTAFPFSIIASLLMMASPMLSGLEFNAPIYWGVPETVPGIKAAALAESEKAA